MGRTGPNGTFDPAGHRGRTEDARQGSPRAPPARCPGALAVRPATSPQPRPLPEDLPDPVERFYRELYGERVPVIDTAVVTGRGTMRIAGVTPPVRYRFTHDAGRAYRHEIETTLFGLRAMTIDESFIDGTARLELPFGASEGPNIDQGANRTEPVPRGGAQSRIMPLTRENAR